MLNCKANANDAVCGCWLVAFCGSSCSCSRSRSCSRSCTLTPTPGSAHTHCDCALIKRNFDSRSTKTVTHLVSVDLAIAVYFSFVRFFYFIIAVIERIMLLIGALRLFAVFFSSAIILSLPFFSLHRKRFFTAHIFFHSVKFFFSRRYFHLNWFFHLRHFILLLFFPSCHMKPSIRFETIIEQKKTHVQFKENCKQ